MRHHWFLFDFLLLASQIFSKTTKSPNSYFQVVGCVVNVASDSVRICLLRRFDFLVDGVLDQFGPDLLLPPNSV